MAVCQDTLRRTGFILEEKKMDSTKGSLCLCVSKHFIALSPHHFRLSQFSICPFPAGLCSSFASSVFLVSLSSSLFCPHYRSLTLFSIVFLPQSLFIISLPLCLLPLLPLLHLPVPPTFLFSPCLSSSFSLRVYIFLLHHYHLSLGIHYTEGI